MRPAKIESWLTLRLYDKSGKLLKRRRMRSRSFVLAFLDILWAQMAQDSQSITDTGGTSRTIPTSVNNYGINANAGDATKGVVVGTGSTAVAISDNKLATQIAHGVGSGQLSHSIYSTTAPQTSGTSRRFLLTRSFANASGGTITVNEVGVYVSAGDSGYEFCAIRDLVSPGQAVNDGQTLAVTYEIKITV